MRTPFPQPRHFTILLLLAVALLAPSVGRAQTPEWIWGPSAADGETRLFTKSFTLPAQAERAVVVFACDNSAELFLNGQRVGRNTDWSKPATSSVASRTKAGENLLQVIGHNSEGIAGLLVQLEITLPGGARQKIVTDASWRTAPASSADIKVAQFPAEGWTAATRIGALGAQPWGDILKPAVATAAESIRMLDGFRVELLRSSQPGEGSWVSMTLDPKGRLIVSPQGEEPMLRITLDAAGQVANIETIDLPVRGAMGLLYAFDSLYVNGRGKEGYHLYRLRDTNGDDKYDSVELLRRWKGGDGEHGAHGIVLGPDQKIYTICGNFVDVPGDLASNSPHRNYADDLVLPRMEDGNGFGAGRKPPGGFVARMNPDGSACELLASGQRNTYDIGFNTQGELFGFDSDMEWDWGMPWYRPIRAYQLVSGGDQGFREGSAKWPEYYADSLPATVNIGIGSPTGVRFGTGAKFPARYQQAFYMMDWSYGRISVVHLKEAGAGYEASAETLLRGKPLNVTDLEIGRDGAMYFTTGGRGTQSGLYRVTYTGTESTAPAIPGAGEASARSARELRRQLESYHGGVKPGAVEAAWPHLRSHDRWLRYAARIAIESQPVDSWKEKALSEQDPVGGLQALLALSRVGGRELQEPVLKTLARWPHTTLDEEQKLVKLRVIEVSLARHGLPSAELRQMALEKLGRQFPAASWPLNRELSQILIALDAPGIASKVLDLRDAAGTQEEQIHYMMALRNLKQGWSLGDRKRYFTWLNLKPGTESEGTHRVAAHPAAFDQWFRDVDLPPANGASFDGFMRTLRKEAVATLSETERTSLAYLLSPSTAKPAASPAVARAFVREWKVEDVAGSLPDVGHGRNFARGKQALAAGQCLVCHKFGNEGGAVGPDITAVSSRFTRADLLSSILEPSKVISEQYENTTYVTRDGDEISGRVLEESADRLVLLTSPLTGGKTELKKSNIASKRKAKLSPMPEGLVNTFSKEELLDLIAYIESMGNANHADFKKP